MPLPQKLFTQQRLMWGAALFVVSILIFYANAPIIPVIVGGFSAPAVLTLRSLLQSSSKSRSRP
jgi:hypothetical protein